MFMIQCVLCVYNICVYACEQLMVGLTVVTSIEKINYQMNYQQNQLVIYSRDDIRQSYKHRGDGKKFNLERFIV